MLRLGLSSYRSAAMGVRGAALCPQHFARGLHQTVAAAMYNPRAEKTATQNDKMLLGVSCSCSCAIAMQCNVMPGLELICQCSGFPCRPSSPVGICCLE
jgi:hypothetical protein